MNDFNVKLKPLLSLLSGGGGGSGLITGGGAGGPGITASGGLVSDYTEGSTLYRAHIFTSTGTLVVTDLGGIANTCLLYTSPSPRDKRQSRMPSSA